MASSRMLVVLLSTSCLQPYQSTKAVSASSFLNSPLVLVRHVFHSSFLPESKDPSEHRCLPAHDHLHLFSCDQDQFYTAVESHKLQGSHHPATLPLQTGGLASIQVCFSSVFTTFLCHLTLTLPTLLYRHPSKSNFLKRNNPELSRTFKKHGAFRFFGIRARLPTCFLFQFILLGNDLLCKLHHHALHVCRASALGPEVV